MLVAINYGIGLETGWIESIQPALLKSLAYFTLYATVYYFSCWISVYAVGAQHLLQSARFWKISALLLAALTLQRGIPGIFFLIQNTMPISWHPWQSALISNITSNLGVLTAAIVLMTIKYIHQQDKLGLATFKNRNVFLLLILLFIPIIAVVARLTDFASYYPLYPEPGPIGIAQMASALSFESSYAFDLFCIELLFRGCLVIGMYSLLGRHAVLPMVTLYLVIHFGKPMGEAISSIVGGYALGIIALRTKSIWGGIALHIGIAMMMEVGAYWSRYA